MKIRNKNILVQTVFAAILVMGADGCKDKLDVGNPNAPTITANVNTEAGLISLAQGGIYINGFFNGDGWLGNSYFSLPWGYNELLADNLGADASNNQVTTVGVPDYIILDDGAKVVNKAPSTTILRTYNSRAATGAGNNPVYYQWLNMYSMNNACNTVLSIVDDIPFSGDATSKANTVKAWCYWWKGYAYASIGSMYYSGLIIDEVGVKNSDYVLHDAVIERSNYYFNLAATTLDGVSREDDYTTVLSGLLPAESQIGLGVVPTKDMWKRSINTMLARNILLNKLSPFVKGNPNAVITKSSTSAVTAADWASILTYATNGIKAGDYIFTGRSTSSNSFFTPTGGTAAALTSGPNTSTTFKISERFMQNFKVGDKRIANNFNTASTYKNNYTFTTRYNMIDGGNKAPGVYTYGSKTAGEYELIIAGSYEENALMLAEANIRTGKIEAGLAYIDAVRKYLGAGIANVAGTSLTLAGALLELVKERRVALIYKGLSFYDNRRWGWTYDIANGGGSYGNTIVTTAGVVNKNVTINYNFLDYWDIPADESELNPTTGAATVNPNF